MRGQTEKLAETASSLDLAIVGQADHCHQQRLTNGHSGRQVGCAAWHLHDEKALRSRPSRQHVAAAVATRTAPPGKQHKKAPSHEGATR